MKKVSIFGAGNMGSRIAFFLAKSRDIARIRLVDVEQERTRATVLDFLESNLALASKIMFVDYEEPKEIDQSDVVIVAAGVQNAFHAGVPEPAAADLARMEELAAQIGHFAPQAIVAVLSQPAELFCSVIAKNGYLAPEKVIGFPLLTYREWYRDGIARLLGVSIEDVRISTVRTLDGEELVPAMSAVAGMPLTDLVGDLSRLPVAPDADTLAKRLRYFHYAPAAIVSAVTGELVGKRRQAITAVCYDKAAGAYFETKALVGPRGFEQAIDLGLSEEQRTRHQAYRDRVGELTAKLA